MNSKSLHFFPIASQLHIVINQRIFDSHTSDINLLFKKSSASLCFPLSPHIRLASSSVDLPCFKIPPQTKTLLAVSEANALKIF